MPKDNHHSTRCCMLRRNLASQNSLEHFPAMLTQGMETHARPRGQNFRQCPACLQRPQT